MGILDAIVSAVEWVINLFSPSPPPPKAPCGPPPPPPVPVKRIVIQINAKVEGTNGLRNAANKRADNVLNSSALDNESLAANAPVILVRGCKPVQLEAITSPAGLPVTWQVKSNENTDGPPTLTPTDGGKKAKLETNVHGSFSVIASLDGTRVVWNVVFVWVKVLTDTFTYKRRDNKYADGGSGGGATNFKSGDFPTKQYPWEIKVKVKVVGGGNSKRLGTNKVQVHILQNGVADTLTGNYAPPPPGTAKENAKGGLPTRDSNGAGDPWMDTPSTYKPDNTSFLREVWTADAPAGGFASTHTTTGNALTGITGINGFSTAIASFSSDAPTALMVHAKTSWSADFKGDVDAAGNYTPHGAKTTAQGSITKVSPATGGQDACLAGFETFLPRFNDGGTFITFTP